MCMAPLTGAGFNPARSFGPAVIGVRRRRPLPAGLRARPGPRRAGRRVRVLRDRARPAGAHGGAARRHVRLSLAQTRHLSRNVTLSLSRTCRCYCKYCAFATHQPHLHEPDEVLRLIEGARAARWLLVLTGEAPDHPGVRAKLAELGFEDFIAYVVWACEQALERGLLPHTNLGVLNRDDLARLRGVTASQGLMLESVSRTSSPTRARRRSTRSAAWPDDPRRRSCGSRSPAASSSASARARTSASRRWRRWPGFDHLQEVILQNFVPHQSYYGREPADIAADAAEEYWRTGWHAAPVHGAPVGDAGDDRGHEAADRRGARLLPGVGIQVPAQPRRLVAGARRRRRDRPRRPEGQRRPHLARAPRSRRRMQVRKRLADGVALAERLCVYGRFIDEEWIAPRVLDVIRDRYRAFIPRRGRPRPRRRARSSARATGAADAGGAHRAVRRVAPRGGRGHAPGRRRAARRAGRRRRSRSSSTATSTSPTSASSAARSAASARDAARPTPTSTTARSSSAACTTRSPSAPPRSACSGASTRLGARGLPRLAAAGQGERRSCTCTRTRPMEIAHMCDESACRRARCSRG